MSFRVEIINLRELNAAPLLAIEKFGQLPVWATQRLQSAKVDQLHTWAKRVLREQTLYSILS